ncbi:hypothetical protein DL95DRAFT_517846 [Leptodontidium sp. 2 PMI_412]|nr:hypothetical protein DL95DRAFT_517846 [Leptodontidium sp. 2 PMI_412]
MSLITSLLLVAFHIYHISATCYNPDGSEIKDPAYQACNQFAGSVSQCCGTNHTGVVAPDTCQANGLCQNNGDSVYWRQGCTDKTWKSPFCLNLCTDPKNGGDATDNVAVGQCSDGSWCCGGVNVTCCNLKQGIVIAATIGFSSTSSKTSSSTSASTPTSTTPLTNPTTSATDILPASTTPSPSASVISVATDGLGNGAKIGIGVGIAGVVVAIAAIAAFFLLKRQRNNVPATPPIPQYGGLDHNGVAHHEVADSRKYPPTHPVEAPANAYRAELGS